MLDFRLLTYEIGNPREIISMRSLRTIDSLLYANCLVCYVKLLHLIFSFDSFCLLLTNNNRKTFHLYYYTWHSSIH